MVSESNCNDLHSHLCKDDSLFDNDLIVTSNEIEDVAYYNKSPGLDGLNACEICLF